MLAWVVMSGALVGACGKPDPIATLASAEGPVERQHGDPQWKSAAIGAKFFLGDAARTADTGAGLELAGGATITMLPHTVLRFGGGGDGPQKIGVELGAIELAGTGEYGLDVGQVSLTNNAKIRITAAGGGKSTIELAVGTAQISTTGGQIIQLELGKGVDLGIGAASVTPSPARDAGVVADAGSAAPADAAVVGEGTEAQVEVIGAKAETQAPDAKDWKPLPAGTGSLPKGTKVRVGAGTTARLTSKGTTLELVGGARASVGDDLLLGLDAGSAKASVPISGAGGIGVPGGAVALQGSPQSPAEVRLDVAGRETKVTVLRGQAKLTGPGGGSLDMNRGESASIAKVGGAIHPIEAIPTYFDFRVAVGDSLTVHDPRPPTAVQFQFLGKCTSGGVIELDHDGNYRTAKLSAGTDNANLMVAAGSWAYRLRCSQGDAEGKQVAAGRIYVEHDDGHRPLPPKGANVNPVDADGRTWRISYQSMLPNLEVHYKGAAGAGSASTLRLHLAQAGKDQTFDGKSDQVTVPGSALKEGTYTYWFDRDGVKQDKVSTLKIDFDQTAPQVYIEAPLNATPFGATIDVKGAVLQGWSAAIEGVDVPIDKQRRFAASVPPPPGQALAIRLSHPQRGVHYYLRRAK